MWKIPGTPAIFSVLIFFSLVTFAQAQFFTKPWVNCKSEGRVKSATEEASLCVQPWAKSMENREAVLEFNICKEQVCLSENLANLPKSLEALISSIERNYKIHIPISFIHLNIQNKQSQCIYIQLCQKHSTEMGNQSDCSLNISYEQFMSILGVLCAARAEVQKLSLTW